MKPLTPIESKHYLWVGFLVLTLSSLAGAAEKSARWEIVTVAGTGQPGYAGDNGPAAQARLNNPYGVARGPDGALYICDMDNQCHPQGDP